jgi:hypothetical protein
MFRKDAARLQSRPRIERSRFAARTPVRPCWPPLSGASLDRDGAVDLGSRAARWDATALERATRAVPSDHPPPLAGVRAFLFGGSNHRTPDVPMPVERRVAADYRTPPASGLRVTWLGHATLLLEIDGCRVLIDPVWGERASPLPFAAKRFFAPPLALADLPAVDAVVISRMR